MKGKIRTRDYRVSPGASLDLDQWPTQTTAIYRSDDHYQSLLREHIDELSALQALLYANASHALLLILQAMDAAGKDSAISHVLSGVNPQGCQVHSFKHPSAVELDHDFLWRTTRVLPERGQIGIFNRSYYEEVLIVRVHPELIKAERLPEEALDAKHFWQTRYHSINELEQHLHRNGTRIVKFFLHVSREEQAKRLLERIDDPRKNWKFSLSDIQERHLWNRYMKAYEHCLSATSSKYAPWYVVPADDKKNARLIISSIINETLAELKLRYPRVDPSLRREMRRLRASLSSRR